MMPYLRLFKKHFALEFSSDMAYKLNFFIKMFALVILDIISPLLAYLIYKSTAGIPGWSFNEFLFFQGVFILVTGISHFIIWGIPFTVIEEVRNGSFDKILIRPFNPLLYIASQSIDLDGIAEIFVGVTLLVYTSIALKLTLSFSVLAFLYLIILAILFQYALAILVASVSFIVVRSYALFEIMFHFLTFARYPASVYSSSLRFFVTFLFPIAISAFYPAELILHVFDSSMLIYLSLSVFGFLAFAIIMWSLGMKKYTSSGG